MEQKGSANERRRQRKLEMTQKAKEGQKAANYKRPAPYKNRIKKNRTAEQLPLRSPRLTMDSHFHGDEVLSGNPSVSRSSEMIQRQLSSFCPITKNYLEKDVILTVLLLLMAASTDTHTTS